MFCVSSLIETDVGKQLMLLSFEIHRHNVNICQYLSSQAIFIQLWNILLCRVLVHVPLLVKFMNFMKSNICLQYCTVSKKFTLFTFMITLSYADRF